jgi:hypothetical protein
MLRAKRESRPSAWHRYLELIGDRIFEVRATANVPFRCLSGGVTEQELNLFELAPSAVAAELRKDEDRAAPSDPPESAWHISLPLSKPTSGAPHNSVRPYFSRFA